MFVSLESRCRLKRDGPEVRYHCSFTSSLFRYNNFQAMIRVGIIVPGRNVSTMSFSVRSFWTYSSLLYIFTLPRPVVL